MRRISKLKLGLLAVVLALAAVPAARAFTLDKAGNTNSDGSAKYTDPDDRYGDQDKSGKGTFSFGGGTTLTVGPQRSFNNDFDSGKERMLSPLNSDR